MLATPGAGEAAIGTLIHLARVERATVPLDGSLVFVLQLNMLIPYGRVIVLFGICPNKWEIHVHMESST